MSNLIHTPLDPWSFFRLFFILSIINAVMNFSVYPMNALANFQYEDFAERLKDSGMLLELIAAIAVNIVSVLFSLWAFKTENYYYVMTHDVFFQKKDYTKSQIKNAQNFNEEVIQQFKDATPDEFEDVMIHDYLKCNRMNTEYNATKVRKLTIAQILLLIGIFLIPILLGILFHASM